MTFDINEARAIIEEAKQKGLIKGVNSGTEESGAPASKPVRETPGDTVIPDWLQEGIRLGPLARPGAGPDQR